MSATLTEVEPLYKRIRDILQRSRNPDPLKLTQRLRGTLTEDEAEELILEGLEYRVRDEIGKARSASIGLENARRVKRLERERVEARAGREEREERAAARVREAFEADMRDPILRVQHEVASSLRSQATRLSLQTIAGQRVCVDGRWAMLEDCTEDDLRTLADEYVERAVAQNMRGAYYRALADTLHESGCRTLGEMCRTRP